MSCGEARYGGPLHRASLVEVGKGIEAGDLSPVELAEAMLGRIEALDRRLKSYATVMAEQARAAARNAEREIRAGRYRGLLHGVPVAVKDLCFTRGVRTMAGSGVFAEFVPDHDATVVSRLEAAGAVVLGKLNLTEGAWVGYHPDLAIPVNPWGEELWPGLSSSGSGVATAAGLCYASLGTDTGGSIRFPSMANGIVGLKPTYGRVSRHGVFPLATTLDHVGPMTRTVEDAAIVLQSIAGADPEDPTTLPDDVPDLSRALNGGVNGVRIGLDVQYLTEGVDPCVTAAMLSAAEVLEGLGASVVEIDVPRLSPQLHQDWNTICAYEAAAAHAATYPSRADRYGPAFRELLSLGSSVPEPAYREAMRRRDHYAERLHVALFGIDVAPIPPGGAPFPFPRDLHVRSTTEIMRALDAVADETGTVRGSVFTFPASLAGLPSLSLPCGADANGLPLTVQLLGGRLGEPMLCRVGHAFQQATDWHRRHPPV